MGRSSKIVVPPPRRQSSALLGLRVTFSGLLCVGVVILVGLAALNSEANLLFLLFGISLGAVLCSAVAPVLMVRKLDIERVAPAAVVAGRPFDFEYVVRTRRRWLRSWGLVIGETPGGHPPTRFPLAFIEALAPDEPRRVELTGLCPVRGRLNLQGVRVLSRFPFGLFAASVDLSVPGELIVYPAVGRFRRDPWSDGRLSDLPAQRSTRRNTPEHDEFYGVREYRPGDNLRWVHWRRSAHAGHLVVRESTPARIQQLTVIVDPWPEPAATLEPQKRDAAHAPAVPSDGHTQRGNSPSGPSLVAGTRGYALRFPWRFFQRLGRPLTRWSGRVPKQHPWSPGSVEQIISLAVTAVCEALERGHRVGLIARGGIPVVIAPSGGRPHRQRLLHELALLKPGAREGLDQLISRVRWSSGWHGRCLVCTTQYNRTHTDVTRFLASRAESVLAITPDSEAFESLFESAGALSDEPASAWRAE